MSFRESFIDSKYDDAPFLSDQLLLPNLAKGHNLHLFSAFAPSYIFRLVSDLAQSPEVEPGFLNIVFFVPGDLSLKSEGIARFRNYLLRYAESELVVAQFIDNVLKLAEESKESDVGGIRLSILHTSQKRPLTKGCQGVISSSENTDDYVAFLDERGGDYNSPVTTLKSWINHDFFAAQEILRNVSEASGGNHPRGVFVSDAESMDWFTHLSNWYLDNQPTQVNDDSNDSDEEANTEEYEEPLTDNFLNYLQELDDFQNETNYGWFGADQDSEEMFGYGNFGVVVPATELLDGHIPPLPISISALVGPAQAHCPCGKLIIRADGCDEVSWDY